MASYFFDSSAIVKRYVEEAGTDWVVGVLNTEQKHRIYLARISGAEVIAALARKRRANELSDTDAAASIQRFRRDIKSRYRIVEITPDIIDHAMSLAENNALRGYDAVQLSAAMAVQDITQKQGVKEFYFVSSDQGLNDIAAKSELGVINPQADFVL